VEARQQELIQDRTSTGSSLIRWGPVFAGAVIGLALAAMAASLWFALAFERGTATFRDYLDWWVAGTAIGGTLVGAFIAGLASARRGPGSGLLQGLTLWGLLVIALMTLGISAAGIFGTTFDVQIGGSTYTIRTTSYWSVFWTMVIGFGAAVIGGMFGGAIPRRERRERTVDRPAPVYFPESEDAAVPPPPAAPTDAEPTVRADEVAAEERTHQPS
jgi:hypothetical protein